MRPLVLFAVALTAACRPAPPVAPIEVRAAWARPADSASLTAAYLVVVNHEPSAVTLSAASSPLAGSVTLHETMEMGGLTHMMALEAPQVIAAGDSLVLAPGGKHLMVGALTRALAAGDSLPLTLTFSDGREVRVRAAVRSP